MKNVLCAAAYAALTAMAAGCTEKTTDGAKPPGASTSPGAATRGLPEEHGRKGEHAEAITLSPEAVRNAQIQLVRAEPKPLGERVTVPARVAFAQRGYARISSRVPGRVTQVRVEVGAAVKKGQVLAFLESPDLGEARASFISAVARARVAGENFRREKDLHAKGITPERELREAEAALTTATAERTAAEAKLHALGLGDPEIKALRDDDHYESSFPVASPIAGTVVEVLVALGQSVETTAPLFVVANLDELWVLLDVSESQLELVSVDMQVEFTVAARPSKRYRGKVAYVGDVVDAKTRTIPVRLVVANTGRELKPGMFATAELISVAPTDAREALAVVVPRQAVQTVADEQVVFIPAGANQFKAVEVETGRSTANEIEIVSGVEAGASVVAQGAFILKSELLKESMGEGHAH